MNNKEMPILQPVEFIPPGLLRSVVHSNGQISRKITIPADWVRHYLYPDEVYLVKGNIIILSSVEDKELADQAAELLQEHGLMESLPSAEMERV